MAASILDLTISLVDREPYHYVRKVEDYGQYFDQHRNQSLETARGSSPQQVMANLERKIADAQRLARRLASNDGARLNKWRKRSLG